MSEDFINQLTLSYLINSSHLNKLNKRMNSSDNTEKIDDKKAYKPRIDELFERLFKGDKPDDLSKDVETGFNFFVEKSIYYFKVHDKHLDLEREREQEEDTVQEDAEEEEDAEDYYEDDKKDYFSEEDSDVGNPEEDEESRNAINSQFDLMNSVDMPEKNVNRRLKKNTFASEGVEDINNLNFNWFESAKRNIKKHSILPRIDKQEK
jgi:hypothetical protein